MRLGMIVRGDQGGLAEQTFAAWKHLTPDVTVLVDLAIRGRGGCDYAKYPGAVINRDPRLQQPALDRLKQCDVVYTIESWYGTHVLEALHSAGVKTVMHVNPELYCDEYEPTKVLLTPTPWEKDRLPARTIVLPVPIDVERFKREPVNDASFLHILAPAMLDRNGTELLVGAVGHITEECTIYVHGGGREAVQFPRNRKVKIVYSKNMFNHAHELYEYVKATTLVLPRRYAGLSLPMNEAAAAGMAIITTNLMPQNQWVHPHGLVTPVHEQNARMKGGYFDVWGCSPQDLAATMDTFARDDVVRAEAIGATIAYAQSNSWPALYKKYRRILYDD